MTRKLLAEALGTMFLLIAVVGSGIMAVRLSAGNDGVALLANALATGGALIALISAFGPISGAHFNPIVSLFELARGRLPARLAVSYVPVQIVSAIAGVFIAHAMFGLPIVQASTHARDSLGEFIGEIVATTGLLLTIWGVARSQPASLPYAVAAYIVGAYWFTSSTSFANPAVTIARALTDTFAGIAPASILAFVAAQFVALTLALVIAWGLRDATNDRGT
ncbi:MAG: aquaporin family protein [Alphaproteobacteria bacterium]|nr:aquaporin family protein [Alphaproteobacteria bacterium]